MMTMGLAFALSLIVSPSRSLARKRRKFDVLSFVVSFRLGCSVVRTRSRSLFEARSVFRERSLVSLSLARSLHHWCSLKLRSMMTFPAFLPNSSHLSFLTPAFSLSLSLFPSFLSLRLWFASIGEKTIAIASPSTSLSLTHILIFTLYLTLQRDSAVTKIETHQKWERHWYRSKCWT